MVSPAQGPPRMELHAIIPQSQAEYEWEEAGANWAVHGGQTQGLEQPLPVGTPVACTTYHLMHVIK